MGYKLILSKTLLRLHKIFYTPLADLLPKLWNPSLAAGLEALARKHQKWGCGITVP